MLGIWKSQLQALVLGVILSVCMNLTSGIKIEVIPPKPKVGDVVTCKVTDVFGSIRFATWYKGQSTNASDQILNFFPPDTELKGQKYFKEAQGKANGSLVIKNIRKDFGGHYTVQVQTATLQQESVLITVSDAISIVLSPLAPLLGMLLLSVLNFL